MNSERVKQILDKIKSVKVAVYGDFCIDAYWILNSRGGEISVETGIQSQAVSKHYYNLGGASNIIANLAALKPTKIKAIGVIGDDIFGQELIRQLHNLDVDTDGMVVQKDNFDTITFSRRYLEGVEQPRIDFGFFNKRLKQTDKAIINSLHKALESFDVLIFNQQVPGSISNEFIVQANALFEKFNDKIIMLDSRHYGSKFQNVWRKTNDVEVAMMEGVQANPDDIITLEKSKQLASKLYKTSNKPVFLTRGSRGMVVADSDGIHEIPGIQLLKKTDSVGAGDTTTSALSLSLAVGFKPFEAAKFANFAAAVTTQKLFQTGTASGDDILEISENANYIYQPELSEDIRLAKYLETSEIELCYPKDHIPLGNTKYAIFDHDGTISTLRQGWEAIMEPVMVKAVMGTQYETADETLYHKVLARVVDYIDKSTGIQTILQMEALVEMVKEFGLVPQQQILDKFGYKKIYNDALMEMASKRIEKFHNGELDISDYTVKGAVDFLKMLNSKGIELYLASGTDYEDVVSEAKVLGYADLFNGGIYGSVGDVSKYSKKMVLENIINENNLSGSELIVFGDGPVEIQESRRFGGIAVGVASDEVRRHGLNPEKRSRLIKAGAHMIVPDFSQFQQIYNVLFAECQN